MHVWVCGRVLINNSTQIVLLNEDSLVVHTVKYSLFNYRKFQTSENFSAMQ